MKISIRNQLLISFLGISSVIILGLAITGFSLAVSHFNEYILEKQTKTLNQFSDYLAVEFHRDKSLNSISTYFNNALESNFYFEVYDQDNILIWRPSDDQLKLANSVLSQQMETNGLPSVDQANLISERQFLIYNNQQIGSIIFYYYGTIPFTVHDTMFINGLKQSIIYISILGLGTSVVIALLISKKLSTPLVTINDFTKKLSQGNFESELILSTQISELSELMNSLNVLSEYLEDQSSLRKRLTYDMSHEIRTPLATLKGNIEAMIDGIWDITPERLDTCRIEIDRLTRLVSNIELINQIENTYDSLEKSYFYLNELTYEVIDTFESALRSKDLQVTVESGEVQIWADKDKIQQVLVNLLNNAIKFSGAHKSINITISQDRNFSSFEIKDTGIGIDNNQLSHIFDRFYTSKNSQELKLNGQGIGLSIVQTIIKAHHGFLNVSSVLNEGTTFKFTLPKK